jgi:hypothetical protein
VLQIIHGLQSYQGAPGRSSDIATIAFAEAPLAITADVIVSGPIEHVQQLLRDEHMAFTFSPFFAGDANIWTTKTRKVSYSPFELMELPLGSNLTDRQVYQLGVPTLLESGM